MKRDFWIATLVACIAAAGAVAEPQLRIEHAAMRVVIIPEARSDIEVSVARGNARLPLVVTHAGDSVTIDGKLFTPVLNCQGGWGGRSVYIWGVGSVAYNDLPQMIVRTPMTVRVEAGKAVFGVIGRSEAVDLSNSGCGDWTVADVSGRLRAEISGSGDVKAGRAQSAVLHISGSGDIATQGIAMGLQTSTSGSGDISVATVGGPLEVSIAGSGDVRIHGGQVSDMRARIAGSGDIAFQGVAESLNANVAGSGDIFAAKVTGPVEKHVAGSGDVRVGS